MHKLLRITLLALPLAGGVAWAQGSGTSGSAGAPSSASPPPMGVDTRTPLQKEAGRVDDTTPVLPGDATKPAEVPKAVPPERSGLPDATGTTPGTTTPGTTTPGTTTPGTEPSGKQTPEQKGAKSGEPTLERKLDRDQTKDTSKTENQQDSDLRKDQLNGDK